MPSYPWGCRYNLIEMFFFRFQMKIINFLNTVPIAYLNTCVAVFKDTKYGAFCSDFKVIVDQDNSIGSGDCGESPNIFNFQKR